MEAQMKHTDISFLAELELIIRQRMAAGAADSYTSRLSAAGIGRVAQKVGEEAVELVVAAVAGDRNEQREEAADLLYHLLVLLQQNEIALAEVVRVLQVRHHAAD